MGEGEGECDEGLRLGAGFGWGHLGEAAVVHGLERVPVRHLHTDEVLQPERGELERAHAPAAHQGEVVELVAEHLLDVITTSMTTHSAWQLVCVLLARETTLWGRPRLVGRFYIYLRI